jgi:uncharacterized cupin superfamily protein
MSRRHPNVINIDELEANETKKGKHHVRNRRLGTPAGSAQLGATLTELPPGAISYPFHFHTANEEAVYILSGTGTLRLGESRIPVRAGDFIAMPIGPDHAHQMINDGELPLIYLCVSTAHKCEVVGYPDSKKIGVSAGPSPMKPWIRTIVRDGEALDYWDSEPGAQ